MRLLRPRVSGGSGLLHQNGAGIEQIEAPTLRVLLGLGPRLRGDDGDVTAGGCGVGEPGREQRGLDTPSAVRGRGRRAGELSDALCHTEAGAAGDDLVAQPDVAHDAGRRHEITHGPRDDLARKLLVRGHPLRVGVGEAIGHDVEPRVELVLTAGPNLDPRRRDSLVLSFESQAEHVLERDEPIASIGHQGADRGVDEVGQLDLHGGVAGGEGPLDLVEGGRTRHAAEAEPRDLVERRALLGKARHTAGKRDHEARRVCPTMAGGLAALGDELRLDPLDALGQRSVAEQGRPVGVHAQSLGRADALGPVNRDQFELRSVLLTVADRILLKVAFKPCYRQRSITANGSVEGVGKTATAQRRAATILALDDANQVELLVADPARLDTSPTPVLVDEWQRRPPVWDLVRRSVDRDPSPGRFLLTGSATPTNVPTHSGAGRIVQLRMRPMSLAERALERPTVSLRCLLTGTSRDIAGDTAVTLADYAEEIVRSGFPGIRRLPARACRAQLDGYLSRIVEREFPEMGHPVRRPATLHAWLRAYAAATSTTTAYNAILDAATPGETDKPAKTTTIGYRDVLTQLWLLEPVPGWLPTRSVVARLAQAPKHHLADPALAARLLGTNAAALLAGRDPARAAASEGPLLGALFESLVTLSVRVYAQAAETTVHHLRTRNGDHEVDLIVERDDGRVVAMEVKLSPSVGEADVKHLRWLRERLGDHLLDSVVITTGRHAYRRADGIAVVPAALLGT